MCMSVARIRFSSRAAEDLGGRKAYSMSQPGRFDLVRSCLAVKVRLYALDACSNACDVQHSSASVREAHYEREHPAYA